MAKRKQAQDSLNPRNELQKRLISLLRHSPITFTTGPAGTGKTYIATRVACQMLQDKEIDRIVVTRPIVEAGENLGFLPGELEDKFAPYFAPIREIMQNHFGGSHVEGMLRTGRIEIAPMAYMRGRTFDNAMVLLDEAQNTTPTQMKLFLTRLGEHTKVCVSGDTNQKDIPGRSGLADALSKIRDIVGVVEFTKSEIVRSKLVQQIVECYEV